MRAVQLPPAVPGHGWPILSTVRYGTCDTPAEFDGAHHPGGKTARVRVLIHDIDPGAAGVTRGWVTAQVQHTGDLSAAAAAHVRNVVTGYADGEVWQVPDA